MATTISIFDRQWALIHTDSIKERSEIEPICAISCPWGYRGKAARHARCSEMGNVGLDTQFQILEPNGTPIPDFRKDNNSLDVEHIKQVLPCHPEVLDYRGHERI